MLNFKRVKCDVNYNAINFEALAKQIDETQSMREKMFAFTDEEKNPRGGFKINEISLMQKYMQLK